MASFKKGDRIKIDSTARFYKEDASTETGVGSTPYRRNNSGTETIEAVKTIKNKKYYQISIKKNAYLVPADSKSISKVEPESNSTGTSSKNNKTIAVTNDITKLDTIADPKHYSDMVNDPTKTTEPFTLSDQARTAFINNADIQKSIENMGIVNREKTSTPLIFHKFDRIGCVDPYNGFVGSKEYVFFTRPDLHLFETTNGDQLNSELANLPLFNDIFDRYPDTMYSLQSSCSKNRAPFICLLSNTISSPLEVPSINANNSIETGANAYGTKLSYRGTSHPSDENITINIEFTDNRYLEVFMLCKLYDEYEKQKLLGYITPRSHWYMLHKILSDAISIFKIVVAEDGESILYYAKYTGCTLVSTPTEHMSDIGSITGNFTFSTTWHCEFFDDLDMEILSDFNAVVLRRMEKFGLNKRGNRGEEIQLYDPVAGMSNGEWATFPYIARIKDIDGMADNARLLKMRRLKLKWR